MAGRGTFRLAVERLVATAMSLCDAAGWSLDDVRWVVPHQANLRIVEAVARRLAVPMQRVVFNGDVYGNTSAASIPLALDQAWCDGRLRGGDRVLCLAFGAGATWGGVALEWSAPALPR
jgi:3-oxoacyl-[acyl-carrier-protein] synthase-3